MPDPKAKDTSRGIPEADEPSPNEISGYFEPNPDNSRELTHRWVDPVDPSTVDPESHVEIVPRAERQDESIASRPLGSGSARPAFDD